MELGRSSTVAIATTELACSAGRGEAPGVADLLPTIDRIDRHERECASLARRMHRDHPEVPLGDIRALTDQVNDELAEARVQSFRLILVERAVRCRLAAMVRAS